jgi:hypothetical protein
MPRSIPGSDREDHASETRELANRARTDTSGHVSGRAFWIGFAIILLAIALFALVLWWS